MSTSNSMNTYTYGSVVEGSINGGDGSNVVTGDDEAKFHWTTETIVQSMVLFFLAGCAEIIGGWMVWMAVRGNGEIGATNKKPWWYALIGCGILMVYGFIPCYQPSTADFGRVYAVYGGVFIVMSYVFGYYLDGFVPDKADISGATIAIIGVGIAYFWPR